MNEALYQRMQRLFIALLGGPGSGGAREGAGRPRAPKPSYLRMASGPSHVAKYYEYKDTTPRSAKEPTERTFEHPRGHQLTIKDSGHWDHKGYNGLHTTGRGGFELANHLDSIHG